MSCAITDAHTKAILSVMPVDTMRLFYTFLGGKGAFSRSKFPAFALETIKKELSTLGSCPLKRRATTSYIRQLKQGQQFGGVPQGTDTQVTGVPHADAQVTGVPPADGFLMKSVRLIAVITLVVLLCQILMLYWDNQHIIDYTRSIGECYKVRMQSYEKESALNMNNILKKLSAFLPGSESRTEARQSELMQKQTICESQAKLIHDMANGERLYQIQMYFAGAGVAVMIAGGRSLIDNAGEIIIKQTVTGNDIAKLSANTYNLVKEVYDDVALVAGVTASGAIKGARAVTYGTGRVVSATASGAIKGARAVVSGTGRVASLVVEKVKRKPNQTKITGEHRPTQQKLN